MRLPFKSHFVVRCPPFKKMRLTRERIRDLERAEFV